MALYEFFCIINDFVELDLISSYFCEEFVYLALVQEDLF